MVSFDRRGRSDGKAVRKGELTLVAKVSPYESVVDESASVAGFRESEGQQADGEELHPAPSGLHLSQLAAQLVLAWGFDDQFPPV